MDEFGEGVEDFSDDCAEDIEAECSDTKIDAEEEFVLDEYIEEAGEGSDDSELSDIESALFEPEPSFDEAIEYESNGYDYLKSEEGQILKASGDLRLEPAERNNYAQRTVGDEYRHDLDDGGHLIGSRFGGSGEKENLVPEDRFVNRGAFKHLEDEWAEELKNGNDVYVEIEPVYHGSSLRPDIITGKSVINSGGEEVTDYFSMTNENLELEKFSIDDNPLLDSFPNAMDEEKSIYGSNDILE